ncbi:hypothetical protein SCAR479_01584 [Seiridium cardinale]|uniref:Uncharacterized protein n=1 Tax=Seiridium cardinale TaxID=138064 RepID=A0ABR2Y6G4_9PEZI
MARKNPKTPSPTHSPRHHSSSNPAEADETVDSRLRKAAELSKKPPRIALEDPIIAHLFLHYIETIAPWYDLNDATNTFSILVTSRALDFPVLFRAIIALSSEIAFAFYATCVEDLLRALDGASNFLGEYLAAACSLQLYEIMSGNGLLSIPDSIAVLFCIALSLDLFYLEESMQNPPCHLLGAYSFSTALHIDLLTWDMAQAGFWNYLREEITVSLASAPNRMVRIGKDLTQFRDTMVLPNIGDDMRANLVSYIVARALNLYCSIRGTEVEGGGPHWLEEHLATWDALMADLTVWTDNLPATFHPFSVTPKPGNAFPSEWMLKPWHDFTPSIFTNPPI